MINRLIVVFVSSYCGLTGVVADEVTVALDVAEVPELAEWGEKGKRLLEEWHPRITNLLSSPDFAPPDTLTLRLKKAERGVGGNFWNTHHYILKLD